MLERGCRPTPGRAPTPGPSPSCGPSLPPFLGVRVSRWGSGQRLFSQRPLCGVARLRVGGFGREVAPWCQKPSPRASHSCRGPPGRAGRPLVEAGDLPGYLCKHRAWGGGVHLGHLSRGGAGCHLWGLCT